MKSLLKILAMACLALLIAQCEVIDQDLLEDPNNPTPANVDPDFLLNNIQEEARNVYAGAASDGAEMTRMRYMFGSTYGNAYSPESFNGIYGNAYSDLFIDVKNLLPIAQERDLYFHSGIAKVLQAYGMIAMVDLFGDMPYSEALDESTFNPGLDSGSDIYSAALDTLDSAIDDLQNPDMVRAPANDYYYGNQDLDMEVQAQRWIRAANTIKLKAYLNTGNASAIQSLIDGDMLITEPEFNFTYQFGTSQTNPDSRHPLFANNYQEAGNNYMTANYMNFFLNDKSEVDPRTRYYFYRQVTRNTSDVNEKTCINQPKPSHFQADDPWCFLYEDNSARNNPYLGYWGRDHLVDDGIPPDGTLRTVFGIYPVGGAFDASQAESVAPDMGLQGAGFEPILMSSFTHFMIAEYEHKQGNTGDNSAAEDALLTAVEHSFQAVKDAAHGLDDGTGFEYNMGDSEIQDYEDVVDNRFDNDPLRTIAKEYYLALWPNGYEAYNSMRRTGYPDHDDNLQPARSPSPGEWYSSWQYPSNMVERNNTIEQKSRTVQVFWDDSDNSKFNY